ncbi:MAG: hypothetical protein KTR31_28870 [Myxococcales bacterium]|nr:hypothetical protein [Myxococcales bacterium]
MSLASFGRMAIITTTGLLVAASAHAQTIALPPLLGEEVTPAERSAIHHLLFTQIESFPTLEAVSSLAGPTTFDSACVTDHACLSVVAQLHHAEDVLAGRVRRRGTYLEIELTYHDGDGPDRRETFVVPDDPSVMSHTLEPLVRKLLSELALDDIAPLPPWLTQPSSPLGSTAPVPEPPERTRGHTTQLALRIGVSQYYTLTFITVGSEVAVPLREGAWLTLGVDSYSVDRDNVDDGQVGWNTIFPVNVGMRMGFGKQVVRPYLGADFVAAVYVWGPDGVDWASGGRVRIGVDILSTPHIGVNLNGALGAWYGGSWPAVSPGLETVRLLPQINAGIIFSP